jgi:hypothetical protein
MDSLANDVILLFICLLLVNLSKLEKRIEALEKEKVDGSE